MQIRHEIYIINCKVYLYVLDFGDSFEYTFYTDNYLVMNTGSVSKELGETFKEAREKIFNDHYLKPESIFTLSPDEEKEFISHIDDYNLVNIL